MTANHRPLEEDDIQLIDRVRASPCLYDTKDPNFRLIYKKEEEWQSIANDLEMSHWEARKRWTVLRDRYVRELKQLILHPDSSDYGKNDFFLRMDFLRNFVKKREVKKRRYVSQDEEITDEPRPIKIYKVASDTNTLESEDIQISGTQKSYITNDSSYQCSSPEKFSYEEQLSQEPHEQEEQLDSVTQLEETAYNDYVEDTREHFEAVEGDQVSLTPDVARNYLVEHSIEGSENITVKPEISKISDDFSFTVEGENIQTLPTLQQRPMLQNRETPSPGIQIDTEEYFSKTIASYLRQLSPRYKIKAKIEMMQIIEKFIELQESKS